MFENRGRPTTTFKANTKGREAPSSRRLGSTMFESRGSTTTLAKRPWGHRSEKSRGAVGKSEQPRFRGLAKRKPERPQSQRERRPHTQWSKAGTSQTKKKARQNASERTNYCLPRGIDSSTLRMQEEKRQKVMENGKRFEKLRTAQALNTNAKAQKHRAVPVLDS